MNFLRKKSMHTKSVFQDKMLRQNYTFKNYIMHKRMWLSSHNCWH